MAYEPGVITRLARTYTLLQDLGVNVWYGEAGDDVELAKMMLENKDTKELLAYCKEYGYLEEEEDDE
jgi:hypothetical protein